MTLNVATLGHAAAANAGARPGDWSKGQDADAGGFNEALSGSAGKSKPTDAGTADKGGDRREWTLGSYRARFELDGAAGHETTGKMEIEGLLMAPDAEAISLREAAGEMPADDTALADAGEPDAAAAQPQAEQSPDEALMAMLRALGGGRDPAAKDAPPQAVGKDDAQTAKAAAASKTANEPVTAGSIANQAAANGADVEAPLPDAGRDKSTSPNARQGGQQVQAAQVLAGGGDAGQRPQSEAGTRQGDQQRQQGPTRETEPQARTERAAGPSATPADPVAARVNVLGFSAAAAAPAQTPAVLLSTTAAGLVTAIEGEPSWRLAAAEIAPGNGQRPASTLGGVNTLRIQLQPVELGMVTARLTVTGSQLSVEIQVENNDARQKLTNDSDMILKALRAVGYDVDKVTIQQQPQGTSAGSQASTGTGRDQFQADQQQRGDANAGGRGGQDGAGDNGRGSGYGPSDTAAERSGSDIYI